MTNKAFFSGTSAGLTSPTSTGAYVTVLGAMNLAPAAAQRFLVIAGY
jgi:hypothetical protein